MDWQTAYLRAIGVKPTAQAKSRLEQWQRWEGGHTNNTARNNYMNTKYTLPGSWDAIGNGVQGYKTLGQGAIAFARTLGNGHYAPLKEWIATGKGDPSQALQVWVGGPGAVGTPSAVSYAQKVLGGAAAAPGTSTTGQAPQSDPLAAPTLGTPSVDPLTAVRQTAAQGFADIAQGKATPDATFGNLLKTLRSTQPQAVKVAIPTTPSAGGGKLERQAANLVKKYLGVQYQWGGENPTTGFDCSGLLQYVWKSLGVNIPRTTFEQWKVGKAVGLDQLQPGDAVFAAGSDGTPSNPGHVGMYIGNGKIIVAPHTGSTVQVQNLSDWSAVGARRFA